ncbi:flagellar motor switch protein FliG [Aliiroseovarius sp. YM-037]|uniref:flagellar motor switch protein FliG n=1 Tax=Aliiroseovarius sp. YM-037 TaxID=3341728 RepID=UPI003A813DAD
MSAPVSLSQPQNPPAAQRPSARLSRKQKAAIVVRILLAEGAKLSLENLPDALQVELTEQMGALRLIDRATLQQVVAEFVEELETVGLAFSGGIEEALSILDGTISPQTAGRMRKDVGLGAISDPWQRIAALDNDSLRPILEDESVEVAAVMLSKLNVSKSAELLGQIPGPRARRIAYAMSLTEAVTPEAVDRIGIALASQMDAQPISAFDVGPVERVGAILNFSPATTRDDVLEGLDETDADFASKVRRAIFTFENIPARIEPRDVPKIIRGVEQPVLLTALAAARAGAAPDATAFILENMSKRMAEQLEEELGEIGNIKESEGEAAMTAVIAEIRRLEADGEISLIAEED